MTSHLPWFVYFIMGMSFMNGINQFVYKVKLDARMKKIKGDDNG